MAGTVEAMVAADGAQTLAAFSRDTGSTGAGGGHCLLPGEGALGKTRHLDAMLARYTNLRQYLPAFLLCPFKPLPAARTLLQSRRCRPARSMPAPVTS